MLLKDELKRFGVSQGRLAEALGKSRATINRMRDEEASEEVLSALRILAELPEKLASGGAIEVEVNTPLYDYFKERAWDVRDGKLHWLGMSFGHGSEYDYEYSPAKIEFVRGLLKQHGSVAAAFGWLQPVEFPRVFVEDVSKGKVCPCVVDMKPPKLEGGRPIPVRVFPFGGEK